ncbi:hypothetical protein PMAYCL1PPCAC_05005, partial [Pristionchus mayeri]
QKGCTMASVSLCWQHREGGEETETPVLIDSFDPPAPRSLSMTTSPVQQPGYSDASGFPMPDEPASDILKNEDTPVESVGKEILPKKAETYMCNVCGENTSSFFTVPEDLSRAREIYENLIDLTETQMNWVEFMVEFKIPAAICTKHSRNPPIDLIYNSVATRSNEMEIEAKSNAEKMDKDQVEQAEVASVTDESHVDEEWMDMPGPSR